MHQVWQYTHDDLDGWGCEMVARNHFRNDPSFGDYGHSITYCQYDGPDAIDGKLVKLLDLRLAGGEHTLLITDISSSKEIFEQLLANRDKFKEILIVDHHDTSAWMVEEERDWVVHSKAACGAKLLYETLTPEAKRIPSMVNFVEAVDAYDRWILDSPHRERGEDLTRLYKFMGKEAMTNAFLNNPDADFSGTMYQLKVVLKDRETAIIRSILDKQLGDRRTFTDNDGKRYAVVFPHPEFISAIGNAVLVEKSDLDYVIMPLMGIDVLSIRSRKGGVNVANIAKGWHKNGGGHQAAAGCAAVISDSVYAHIQSLQSMRPLPPAE